MNEQVEKQLEQINEVTKQAIKDKYISDKDLLKLGLNTSASFHPEALGFKARNKDAWMNLSLCEQNYMDAYVTVMSLLGVKFDSLLLTEGEDNE